jgi:hypothetical protein
MGLSAPSEPPPLPLPPKPSALKILDFVPMSGASGGGEKMLLCLHQPIPAAFASSPLEVIPLDL